MTRRFRSLRKSNILIESCLPLRVLQQHTAMTYTKWMLHIADFSDQWSGLLATYLDWTLPWHEIPPNWNERVRVLGTLCYVFIFHLFFMPVPNGARHFLAYRLDSTRLAFGYSLCRQDPNHGRSFVYNTIGGGHNISQHYLSIPQHHLQAAARAFH